MNQQPHLEVALRALVEKWQEEASSSLSRAIGFAQYSDEWRKWMDFTGMAKRHADELAAILDAEAAARPDPPGEA